MIDSILLLIAVVIVVLALVAILASGLFVAAARKAAKASVADTLRVNAIQQHRFSVFAGETSTDWGVMSGTKLMATSGNLRTAIDTAINEATNG